MDRLTLIDGVCRDCKQIIRRDDVSELSPKDAERKKAEVAADGLVAAHYTVTTDAVKVATLAHKATCPTRQVPPAEREVTEVMAGALGVKSQPAKQAAKKKRKIGKRKK